MHFFISNDLIIKKLVIYNYYSYICILLKQILKIMKKILMIICVLITQITYSQDTLKSIELDGISVTGVRADSKTPVTQTTIYGGDIKKTYQGEEVSFILGNTPSVTTSYDGGHPQGYTYFRLRGIDQTRINMTLNGVPLNEPEDQGVYFSNFPGFSNNIKSMQIQRGVGTSTNGVSSYAGSINFESPFGLDEGTTLELGYGSFNTKRININTNSGLFNFINDGVLSDNSYSIYTNFSSFDTDGYKYNSGSNGYSGFIGGAIYGKKDVLKLTAFSGRSFNQMAWSAVSEIDIKNDPRTNYNTPVEDDDFRQSFIQLQHIRSLSSKSLISTTVYYNKLVGQWDLDLAPLTGGVVSDVLNYQLNSNFYGLMSNYKYTTEKLNLNIGIHGNLYNREHAQAVLPTITDRLYTNTGYKNEISGFGKFTYDIGKLSLFGDGQLRHVTFRYNGDVDIPNLDWTFFNPKAGLVYNYNDKIRTYFSIGKSNREPTRNDMFMGEDNLIEYTEVIPEEVIDYELGFSYLTNKFNINTNLYYMDFKNEITLIGALGSNGLPLMTNVNTSFRSGIEIEATYKIINSKTHNLTLSNNTNLSYNRIFDNDVEFQPLYTPPLVSNSVITYTHKNFFIGVNGKYHSTSYIDFDNEYTTPSFLVFGLDAGYNYERFTLTGRINNITNQEYFTNGYVIDETRYFFVNAPTSVYLTLKVRL